MKSTEEIKMYALEMETCPQGHQYPVLDGFCETCAEAAMEFSGECQGHPDDGEFDGPAGQTYYCDGSCVAVPVPR